MKDWNKLLLQKKKPRSGKEEYEAKGNDHYDEKEVVQNLGKITREKKSDREKELWNEVHVMNGDGRDDDEDDEDIGER